MIDIKGYEFTDDYNELLKLEYGLLMAELDDIVQLLANQSNAEWTTRHDNIMRQYTKIKNAIRDRLHCHEEIHNILFEFADENRELFEKYLNDDDDMFL